MHSDSDILSKFEFDKTKDVYQDIKVKLLNDLIGTNILDGSTEIEKIKSPIEQLLYLNLKYQSFYHGDSKIKIIPQYLIETRNKKYFADFLISMSEFMEMEDGMLYRGQKLIIECDGHDFHYNTKEKIEQDRIRERNISKLGYEVIRYTGTELYRDSSKCAFEVLQLLENKLKKKKFQKLITWGENIERTA